MLLPFLISFRYLNYCGDVAFKTTWFVPINVKKLFSFFMLAQTFGGSDASKIFDINLSSFPSHSIVT